MATSTPVLDLTVVDPVIRINGDDYPLRIREDLTILTNAELAKKFGRIEALRLKRQKTKRDETELGELLEHVTAAVLKAPPELLAKLTQFQRLNVVTAFFEQVAISGQRSPIAATSTSKK